MARLFIAVEVPAQTRDQLRGWAQAQRLAERGWRLVRPENLHLTLRFLGDTGAELIDPLAAALASGVSGMAVGSLEIAGWGVFPSPHRPRVLWAGLRGDLAGLDRLAARVEDAIVALGLPADERPFRPHLTLARSGRTGRATLPGGNGAGAPVFGPLPVDRVCLVRSHLGPAGPRYERLAAASVSDEIGDGA